MTTKKFIKRSLVISGFTLLLLLTILCVHVYMATRPHAPDPDAVAMARIDVKQVITQADADKITACLYQQNGIDHVLCNPQTGVAVFTYYPAKTTADLIINAFKSQSDYKITRFIPSAADLAKGCPAMSNHSLTYKVYSFFKHIF